MESRFAVALLAALASLATSAEMIGGSMALFYDGSPAVLGSGMTGCSGTLDGATQQIKDTRSDVSNRQNQILHLVASVVDAVIVNPVDTDPTFAMSEAAAGIPLIDMNREPVNRSTAPGRSVRDHGV